MSDSLQSWVGWIQWQGEPEFISVTVAPDAITAELPHRYQFRCPVAMSDAQEWHIELTEGTVVCRHGSNGTGSCEIAEEQGILYHYPLYPLSPNDYRPFIGIYHADPHPSRHFTQNLSIDVPLFFYEAADNLVRLYPIATDTFLSERCEIITFAQDASHVTIKTLNGAPLRLERQHLYTEEHITIPTEAGHVLGATLLLPTTPAPHPAVLFCHYADTHFRDYYRLFAEFFVKQGIAALIYDKRGWGDSTGESLYSTIAPLADDAVAVYRFLQAHPAIHPERIGFWGASNGGWVAPLAASQVENPAFVIGVSAAGVTPAYQEQGRRVNLVRDLGASPEAVALLNRMWELLFAFRVAGIWTEETATVLQAVYDNAELQALPKQADYGARLQAVPPIIPIEEVHATDVQTWREGGFDPAPIYAALSCPLLFVWGDADTVIPVEEGRIRLTDALNAAHHSDFTMVTLPDTTHKIYHPPHPAQGLNAHEVETRLHGIRFTPESRRRMANWTRHSLERFSIPNA